VNGVDVDSWNPATDRTLVRRYGIDDALEGKAVNKAALFEEAGLGDASAPLFGCVSRLTGQKGIDLVLGVIPALVAQGVRVVVLGTGEDRLEDGPPHNAARQHKHMCVANS